MKEHIVVVGGYGHVGQTICRELGELYMLREEAWSVQSNLAVQPAERLDLMWTFPRMIRF
ncbi:hypothetical protein [Aneurinibacillus migulanus]|uniref:Uncharacterized protein n=1 Tax=Aneurinibacillus migulanus TaxID=47500 RepID=A0A0D1UY57_ANEMI|nr:hypothetical protein [Aneurinibacillus migulanus]KIV52009.1 hypothetical protein TS65_26075 [Aneurinibacillus migulanus]KON98138.1 hypothetical protein AF333_24555 [Aneurinibacillus migulanus]MED0891419.1 hypothetical protein [Aneurinibacillus migulanus]MED1613892.1 hypothetical protein [Aneurinibacillus migulanus]MED4728827.1 hypothetical protein [Aneurinibacillus migulanus]